MTKEEQRWTAIVSRNFTKNHEKLSKRLKFRKTHSSEKNRKKYQNSEEFGNSESIRKTS